MNGYGQAHGYLPGYVDNKGVFMPPALGRVGEMPRLLKEWASTETGTTVVGVATGIAVGEWFGTIVSEYAGMEAGWQNIALKSLGKGILSFVLFVVARRTGGMAKVFLYGASAGPLISIVGDIVGQFAAPALGLVGVGNAGMKGLTIKVNKNSSGDVTPVGSRSQVISSL